MYSRRENEKFTTSSKFVFVVKSGRPISHGSDKNPTIVQKRNQCDCVSYYGYYL